tara:strand:- start:1547 stop:2266 length:720 start_codon:yes stop_codon:yes gene_type:complete
MSKAIENQVGDWYPLLDPIVSSDYFRTVGGKLKQCKQAFKKVYPETTKTFRAFKMCQMKDVKVVILGQDPYHDGSATGLCFGNTNEGSRISPSLRNIVKAVETDLGTLCVDFDYSLESWANQGVLLLNTALTVEKGKAGSHVDLWKPFTQDFIHLLTSTKDNIIFVLWGKKAQEYEQFIKGDNKILKAAHPAAESYSGGKAGFFTCGHFSTINKMIDTPINWAEFCGDPLPRPLNKAPF